LLYKLTEYPHVGLVDPRTGQLLRYWSGFIDASTLSSELGNFIASHSLDDLSAPPLPVQQKAKVDLTEEEMLAEAIAASLQESSQEANSTKEGNGKRKQMDSEDGEGEGVINSGSDNEEKATTRAKRVENEAVAAASPTQQKEHEGTEAEPTGAECTLQIRAMDGSTFSQTFREGDTLDKVRRWLISSQRLGGSPPFALVTPFPRRTFSAEDHGATLRALGLTPRAVLIVHPTS